MYIYIKRGMEREKEREKETRRPKDKVTERIFKIKLDDFHSL